MRAPCGIIEITEFYGDPAPFVRDDGTVSSMWEDRMVKVPFPRPLPLGWRPIVAATGARVNRVIAQEVERVFRALDKAGLWDHFETFDGGYTWRPMRGSRKLSMHGFGGALDFNAGTNRLGEKGDMDSGVVAVFENFGWTWGGEWTRPDPMHFAFARGY